MKNWFASKIITPSKYFAEFNFLEVDNVLPQVVAHNRSSPWLHKEEFVLLISLLRWRLVIFNDVNI